jgi:hypothetical protein
MEEPKPCSYIAIADGEKQLNAAQVVCILKERREGGGTGFWSFFLTF